MNISLIGCLSGGRFPQQVEFVNAAAAVDSGSGTTSVINGVGYPANMVPGNLLLLVCTNRAPTVAFIPSGWTSLFSDTDTDRYLGIFYRFVTGTESGTFQVAYEAASSNVKIARVYQYKNVRSVSFTESGGKTASLTTATHADLTATDPLSLAVSHTMSYSAAAQGTFSGATGGTWSEPVADYVTSTQNGSSLGTQIATLANPGTISGGSMALVNNLTRAFVLRP